MPEPSPSFCPVCDQTTTSQFVHATRYPEHHYPGAFMLRRCDQCGLLFNAPRLEPAALGALYGANYYFFLRDDAREFSRIVAMYQRTIAMLPQLPDEKRCIDIGCGRGYFPLVLKELGWHASGIEISDEASKTARESFGLDIFTGTVEQYAGSPQAKKFPLVTAIDVIEHVPDPAAFISAAAKLVAPGGWLIIDTPNGKAANIARKGLSWKGFNPFHVYLLSIENLNTLVTRNGLSARRAFTYGNASKRPSLRDRSIAGFKRIGLLGPMVSLYFAAKKTVMPAPGKEAATHAAAARAIEAGKPYDQSDDATNTLAPTQTGDNVIVIARRA